MFSIILCTSWTGKSLLVYRRGWSRSRRERSMCYRKRAPVGALIYMQFLKGTVCSFSRPSWAIWGADSLGISMLVTGYVREDWCDGLAGEVYNWPIN